MSDKLREAALAAYKAMIAAELSDGSRREWEAAVDGLKDALAEPTVKESLTFAMSGPPLKTLEEQQIWLAGFNEAKRPWVGLTGTEINHIFARNVGYPESMMKDVETLLKEKNT